MKNYKWGRIMTVKAIGFGISWGTSSIPSRKYIAIEIPFLIVQIWV